jgi:hypothetical protein
VEDFRFCMDVSYQTCTHILHSPKYKTRVLLFFLIHHVKCWVLPYTHAQKYTHVRCCLALMHRVTHMLGVALHWCIEEVHMSGFALHACTELHTCRVLPCTHAQKRYIHVGCCLALMHRRGTHMSGVALHACSELHTCQVLPCTHAQSYTHVGCHLALMHRDAHIGCHLALIHRGTHMSDVALHTCPELHTCWVLPCTHAQRCARWCHLTLMHRVTHIFIIIEDGELGQQLHAGSFCIRVNVLTAVFMPFGLFTTWCISNRQPLVMLNVVV